MTTARPAENGMGEDRVPAILAAAEIVIDRFGHDRLSLTHISRVSLIPIARIYQHFADRNAVLGALSARALTALVAATENRSAAHHDLTEAARLSRVVDRLAVVLAKPSDAYLVLCGPFDAAGNGSRRDAVHRLSLALGRELERQPADEELLEYAAELVFACLRRGYLEDGRVVGTGIRMAQRALSSFLLAEIS